ncbi:MAG: DUF992 domain-containing protein [Flavobacteriaceae bacterium]
MFRTTLAAAAVALIAMAPGIAKAQAGGVELGRLTCEVEGGAGFVFGSTKNLLCTFKHAGNAFPSEVYTGQIQKFGIDIGVTGKSVIVWGVVAAEPDIYAPGSLAGTYGGAGASAAFAVGLGANVLVGGSRDSFALQPLSVSGETGVNVAAGITRITLVRAQ